MLFVYIRRVPAFAVTGYNEPSFGTKLWVRRIFKRASFAVSAFLLRASCPWLGCEAAAVLFFFALPRIIRLIGRARTMAKTKKTKKKVKKRKKAPLEPTAVELTGHLMQLHCLQSTLLNKLKQTIMERKL